MGKRPQIIGVAIIGGAVGALALAFVADAGWLSPGQLTPDRMVAALSRRGGDPVGQAGGYPIVLYGPVHLPPILPHSDALHAALRAAHTWLAFLLFGVILLHLAAALFRPHPPRRGLLRHGPLAGAPPVSDGTTG